MSNHEQQARSGPYQPRARRPPQPSASSQEIFEYSPDEYLNANLNGESPQPSAFSHIIREYSVEEYLNLNLNGEADHSWIAPDPSGNGYVGLEDIPRIREEESYLLDRWAQNFVPRFQVPAVELQRARAGTLTGNIDAQPSTSMLVYIMDHISTKFGDRTERTRAELKSHGVTDLWLPLPKHTTRRIFDKLPEEKEFVRLQQEIVDASTMLFAREGLGFLVHTALDDGDEFIPGGRILGEGAFGTVDLVSAPTKPVPTVCVRKKIPRPRQLNAQKQIMAAFTREIHVMRQIDHRHCVRLLGSYTDLDSVNILSAPVADMDLATFLDRPIGDEQKKILYRGIHCLCNALNYLHQKKIRHEDLKPQNVLIHGNNILLTDFGFSLDFSDDSISTTIGRPSAWTVRYSAPEVLEFEPRNRASDIFSLGCVIYEMISGIHGHSLSKVKEHWRRVGNGQPSFARNPEAAWSWIKPLQAPTPCSLQKLRFLRGYIPSMLDPNRLHRPSAQQVVDRLSDWSCQTERDPEDVPVCCARQSLVEKVFPFNLEPEVGYVGYVHPLTKPWILAEYFYPSHHHDYTYMLLDLSFNLVSSKHYCYSQMEEPVSNLFDNFSEIVSDCENLYHGASRTGTTKEFWEAHTRWEQSHGNLAEAKDEVETSAKLLSLKHVVFIISPVDISIPRSADHNISRTSSLHRRNILISLLPVCLPRASSYGAFFYMLSFQISQRWDGVGWEQNLDHAGTFVDLTVSS